MKQLCVCEVPRSRISGVRGKAMQPVKRAIVVLSLAAPVSLFGGVFAFGADYKLGPMDKLDIKVSDWRSGSSEAHRWTAVSGEVVVGPAGQVSLPLLGEIPAAGKSTAELAQAVSERLRDKIGLAQLPDAAIEIIKYRPFYVLGSITNPGEYEYRPGLTLLQAISVAGGLSRPKDYDSFGLRRESLVQGGEARRLHAERISLLAKQARLDALATNADQVVFPPDLAQHRSDPAVEMALSKEEQLFKAARDAAKSQVASLLSTQVLYGNEISTLIAKNVSLAIQLKLANDELNSVTSLVERGFATVSRKLDVERSKASYETNRLDVELALLRAKQQFAEVDRSIADITNKLRSDALRDESEVIAQIATVDQQLRTAQALLFQSDVQQPGEIEDARNKPQSVSYTIIRSVSGATQSVSVDENATIEPGDTIRIELEKADPAVARGG